MWNQLLVEALAPVVVASVSELEERARVESLIVSVPGSFLLAVGFAVFAVAWECSLFSLVAEGEVVELAVMEVAGICSQPKDCEGPWSFY